MRSPTQPPSMRQRPSRSVTMEQRYWDSIMPPIDKNMPPRVPAPSHRHAAPSGPWPFLDLNDPVKYNIEPFYFSSSVGWIPSRYQEEVKLGDSDHITISLTFIRTMQHPVAVSPTPSFTASTVSYLPVLHNTDQVIDTQAPLFIRSSDHVLLPDLLALHMVRSRNNSTIISYHPSHEHRSTTAASLHSRLNAAGHSVYWSNMFAKHDDPTFVFLSILWYALYAWDEALEVLYAHICWVESRVIHSNDINLTQELHVIQAHLLHYGSLLEDFRKSVSFVLKTPYPGLDNLCYTPEHRERSKALMKKECKNLLIEIERLDKARSMQIKRLKNVMNLGFSSVNIEDSRRMHQLTEASLNDSADNIWNECWRDQSEYKRHNLTVSGSRYPVDYHYLLGNWHDSIRTRSKSARRKRALAFVAGTGAHWVADNDAERAIRGE
ncbi:hypothetical protein C0995_008023 [Termitomyces sp. Mi166|nr:hypothetical protein C0995_008023 [Termitomyces sp. Mi166\